MLKVDIKSNKAEFMLELRDKITVIQGVSGSHKTQMIKTIESRDNAHEVTLSNNSFRLVVLSPSNWDILLSANSGNDKKFIYFVDDADFVEQELFAALVKQDKSSYFVFINRVSGMLSFNVDAMYKMSKHEKQHTLEPLYVLPNVTQIPQNGILMTEDSTSGKRWWEEFNGECDTSYGNPGIVDYIKVHPNETICMAVDLFGLGYFIEDILCEAERVNAKVTFLDKYGSFEYMLLSSNFFGYTLTEEDILGSISKEIACEKIIDDLTAGTLYRYKKSYNINYCYYKECCAHNRNDKCDRGLSGNKIEAMFIGTKFEYLLSTRGVRNT